MNIGEEQSVGLTASGPGTLSRSKATSLVARGRTDLRNKEEAETWLRRGLELYQNAPGWSAYCSPKKKNYEQILRIREYMEVILAGEKADSAAERLKIAHEDREMAHTILFFVPSSIPVLVQTAQKHGEEIANHEDYLKEAFHCFERGLELDPYNLELIDNLGSCYSSGQGVEQDEVKARGLLQRAADMGGAKAQTALGYIYSGGLKGGPDMELAVYWLRKAAVQGDETAINALRYLEVAHKERDSTSPAPRSASSDTAGGGRGRVPSSAEGDDCGA